jgi:hypothetical protein
MPDTAQIETVTAPLKFVVRGSTPVSVPNEPGVLKLHQYEGEHAEHAVRIENARPRLGEISLDREGFAIVNHHTDVDFYDEEQRTKVYDLEVEELLKKELGAKKVIVFDHTLRAGDDETRVKRVVREPVQMVHNDYTARSGPQRLRDQVGDAEAEELLKGRMAIVNVWRGNRKPVKSMPLAIADARTIDDADLVSTERRAKDRIGEIQHMVYNPDTRWYYVPNMETDEAMLIKCYDSDESVARFTAHSAFADPNTPADAPFRESIETRTFVFF